MRVLNFSKARSQFKTVINQVIEDEDIAVIMSLDSYNSLLETVHLLKTPANALHLATSIAQLRQGQRKEYPLIPNET